MFSSQGSSVRRTGVVIPAGQGSIEQGAPKKLEHLLPAEMFGIGYTDEGGVKRTAVVVKIGEQWFLPPNAESWAASLKPTAPWLSKQLDAAAAAQSNVVPADGVDVTGSGT